MIEEIYKYLESSGWIKEMIEGAWVGYHAKTHQSLPGFMIINGQRIKHPPVITKIEIEYTGDGWISNPNDSNRVDTTQWDIRLIRDGELRENITIIVYSLEQFIETINEMNI